MVAGTAVLRYRSIPAWSACDGSRSNGHFAGFACGSRMQNPRSSLDSIAERQAGVAPRIVRAVEAVLAHRLAAQRRRADQDRREVVRRLRVAELVTHALEDLARV